MGIFSLFGKKGQQQSAADKGSARQKRDAGNAQRSNPNTVARPQPAKRDAQAARATAMKIDAIESEMSSEFVAPITVSRSGNTIPAPDPVTISGASVAVAQHGTQVASHAGPPTLQAQSQQPLQPDPDDGDDTTHLLLGSSAPGASDAAAPNVAPVVEEAAILFASGQADVVGQMLHAAIASDTGSDSGKSLWLMLFDLYQITGKQQEFEQLSIDYASRFETSPPGWQDGIRQAVQPAAQSDTTPIVAFNGKLDAGAVKFIDRIQKLAETYRGLRLEFVRVTEVNSEGCSLLLAILMKLQKSGHDLVLVGARELSDKVRGIIEVGRRDDTEPSWLLLLELLRLLNQEKEFEEASIDYCVTFEVSPPAFVAPKNKVTTAATEAPATEADSEGFLLPPVIEGRIDNLILAVAAYSDEHNPAIIDCSQLLRVDFNAAGRLLTGLAPFCGNGKTIEFHHVNHLVVALFAVIGLQDLVRVLPRKN